MAVSSVPLAVFQEHVRQIELGIRFIYAAGAVRRCVFEVVNWESGQRHALDEIRRFHEVGEYPERQHCNANFLSLVAGFEEFLCRSLEAAILAKARRVKTFDELGAPVHDLHMKATGYLLTQKAKPPQQLQSLDFFQLCRNIGTCFPGSTSFELNPEAISVQSNLLDLESFIETLGKFGYRITWDILGGDQRVKDFMGIQGTREAGKLLRQFLADMVRNRNRVAHTGSASDITPDVLTEYLNRLRLLAQAISDSLG
ncbi:HEPN domain-containing protein [Desulfuromonas sp. TF]|uniref:HEPN domain-containing protein n=1 Tax=Desulfuromonas sp. TF TaxID=1232410 RepID=UPI00048890FF|nr:HEPN domain-containing protein [Desulfuromonas sp. TF]